MPLELSSTEARILGCLLEKERTTPEYYPLSLNGLTTACNQTTNRDPIVNYDERTVENGLDALREKKLAMIVHGAGARVPKYRHCFLDHYNLDPRQVALISVLLLRGAQTSGELRSRTERMAGSSTLAEIEAALEQLMAGEEPFVRLLPVRPGQKERRYVQLFWTTTEVLAEPENSEKAPGFFEETLTSRVEALELEVRELRAGLEDIREALKTNQS